MLLTKTISKPILFGLGTCLLIVPIIMIFFNNRNESKRIKLHSNENTVKTPNENEINAKCGIQPNLKKQYSCSIILNNQKDTEAEGKVKDGSSTFNKTEIKKNKFEKNNFDNNETKKEIYDTSRQPGIKSKEKAKLESKTYDFYHPESHYNNNAPAQDIHSESNASEDNLTQNHQSESKSYENDPTQDISIKSNELESKSNKNDQQGSKSNNNFQSESYFDQNTSTQDIQNKSKESEKNYNENSPSAINSSEKEQLENILNENDVINLGSTQILLYDEGKSCIKQVKDCSINLSNNKNDVNIINAEDVPKNSETKTYMNNNKASNCIKTNENGNMIHVNVPIHNTTFLPKRTISINENENNKIPNQDETLVKSLERKYDCSSCQVVNEHDTEETLSKKEELVMINLEDSAADMTNHSCSTTKSESNSENISTEAEIPESSCLKGLLSTKKGKNSQEKYKDEGENEVSFSMEKLYKLKEMQKNVTKEDNLSSMDDPKKSSPLNILSNKNKSKEERFKFIEIQAEKNKSLATEETIPETVFEVAENREFKGELNDCCCVATETIHDDKKVLVSKESTKIGMKNTESNKNSNKEENCQALILDEKRQTPKSNGNGQNLILNLNRLYFKARRDIIKSELGKKSQDSKKAELYGKTHRNTNKKNPMSSKDLLENQKFLYNLTKGFDSPIQENSINVNKIIYAFRNILGDISTFYNNDKSMAFDFIDTKIVDKNLNTVENYTHFKFKAIRNKYEKSYEHLNNKEIKKILRTRYLDFDEYFLQILTTHFRLSYLFYTSDAEFGNFMSCIKNNEFVLFELIYSFYSVNINKKNGYAQMLRNAESKLIQFFCDVFDFNVPSCVNPIYYAEARLLFKIMKKDDMAVAFRFKFLELLNKKIEL